MNKHSKTKLHIKDQTVAGMSDPQEYLEKRKNSRVLKYRMNKRINKIISAIRQWERTNRQGNSVSAAPSQKPDEGGGIRLLDVGGADGKTLTLLRQYFSMAKAIGIEPCAALRQACQDRNILLLPGEGEHLPFKNSSFDVVVVASVIEHVNDARKLIQECYRVLDKGGILIVSAVDPFFDKLATLLSLKRDDHVETFTLQELREIFNHVHFRVTAAEKFGLISLGLLPFEEKIEKLFNKCRLYFTMYYQFIAGIK